MAKLTKKPSKNTHIKKKASTQPIEEGILDSLRGGQTSQQKAVQQRFVSNFIGSLVSAVDNAIKAKVVDPKLTAKSSAKSSADADAEGSDAGSGRIEPTVPAADSVVAERHNNSKYEKLNKLFESILNEQQATPKSPAEPQPSPSTMSVSAYINNQFLPRYVSNWKSIPPEIRKRMTDLVRQLDDEKWNSYSRKSVLNTLAGLIYTNVSLPNRGPAGRQQPDQAGGSGSSQAGGSGSSQAGAMVHKDLTDLQKNWPNLSDEEKKKVKDYIASLT